MQSINKQDRVKDKIYIVNEFLLRKESYYNKDLNEKVSKWVFKNPYSKHLSLNICLLLSCFDSLYRPDDFLEYGKWLWSKEKEREKKEFFELFKSFPLEKQIVKIHDEFNSRHGIRNSFYRFILEKLSIQNKTKLLDSIQVSRTIRKPVEYPNGVFSTGESELIQVSEYDKLNFLYELRSQLEIGMDNKVQYTPFDDPRFDNFSILFSGVNPFKRILFRNESKTHTFIVNNWPELLLEILEDYLNSSST